MTGIASPRNSGSVAVGAQRLQIWPEGQTVRRWRDTSVLVTRFDDHPHYAGALRDEVLERAADPALSQTFDRSAGVGSTKVYDIGKWPGAAAALVNARALALFRLAAGSEAAVVDLSWASVYYDADLCLPHSHPRTLFSVLYVVDLGEAAGADHGTFLFADPRLAPCCRVESGYMSTPSAPGFKPGMMVLFPGKLVHLVTPYRGERPRLTMSWNLNKTSRHGEPLPDWVTRPS